MLASATAFIARRSNNIALGSALAYAMAAAALPAIASAQKPAVVATVSDAAREQLAEGDKATVARQSRAALEHYERALQTDPRSYEALWKASGAQIDLSEVETDEKKRDAIFTQAVDYARKAVEVNADGADGHFNLARALGRARRKRLGRATA